MSNPLSRKEKVKLLQDLQKGKTSIKNLVPAIHITFMYTPDGNIVAINTDDWRIRDYKTFTDSSKNGLIESIKSKYPTHRIDVNTISLEKCQEIKKRLKEEY